ncbi:helix-turn-helix domain-containing protein [Amycolatopsis sp. NPDC059027]|uniref:helix-turn-helix domain-containing protein n=1 Tax=Amycolatopsis sp. NPDC059027 TaxID=3346709 RepID=UPI00366B00C3
MKTSLTFAQIQALPAIVDIVTAGQALGIGRNTAYAMAKAGTFPCRVIKTGASYRVPTTELMTLLGIQPSSGEQG